MAQFCLIGEKLGHSFSKRIHNIFGYDYDLVEVPNSKLEEFVASKKYCGFNVTIPYKTQIIPLLDRIDKTAAAINSVNTVVLENGKYVGYNTDILGMRYALDYAGINLTGAKTLILGSGGTSKTAKYVAESANASEVTIISRNGENNYENISKFYDYDVIINTTPVGMFPNNDKTPIELHKFTSLIGVFDAIYNPLRSRLVLSALDRNIAACGGLAMLVGQAKCASDLFFDKVQNIDIEKVYKKLTNDQSNIVLVGMAGCGKTTIGKQVAEKLGKEFVDSDEEIIRAEGIGISDIFAQKGEEYFRERESAVIKKLSARTGCVIATGGGVVLDPDNIQHLRQNGIIVWIKRSIKKVDMAGRPLSKDIKTVKIIYKKRKPIYRSMSDFTTMNVNIDKAVNKIVNRFV